MNIAISILIVIAGIILLLLIIAAFSKKDYKTHREVSISAPSAMVFDYLRHIKNQDHFNKWVMADPQMEKKFTGTDGTVGFIYGWNGNKQAGEGEQEIKAIQQGKAIETEIRFIRPFAGLARAEMTVDTLPDNHSIVHWTTESEIKYPLNLMRPMIVKMLEKDMDISLSTLKSILEK